MRSWWWMGALFVGGWAVPAAAEPVNPWSAPFVVERLVAAQAGDTLRKACPAVQVRWLRVLSEADALERWARANGHTEEGVRAFLGSETNKAEARRRAQGLLEAFGYVAGDSDSACTAARAIQAAPSGVLASLFRISPAP